MLPDVSEIDLPLACRLYLIDRAALKRKMVEKNSKRMQARYKRDYNGLFWFEPHFGAGDCEFVERHLPWPMTDISSPAQPHGTLPSHQSCTQVPKSVPEWYRKYQINQQTTEDGQKGRTWESRPTQEWIRTPTLHSGRVFRKRRIALQWKTVGEWKGPTGTYYTVQMYGYKP